MILILAAATLMAAGCSSKSQVPSQASAKGPDPIAVKTARSEARTVQRSMMATGSLLPDETTSVSSEVPGRVAKIYVDFGQQVKAGQVLVELDTQELQLQLERTRATLQQALARIGLDLNSLNGKAPESTPMMRQAQAQMEDARSKYENAAKLAKSGDVSQERYNELEKAYRTRQAAYEATKDELRTQMAAISSLRAEEKLAEKRVRDATVRAPFDGAVSARLASPGQYIKENTAMLTLVKTNPLRLRVDVPESAVGTIKVGTLLTFTTEAAPGQEFKAVVSELQPNLDSKSRTLQAEARLSSPDPRLKSGSFVQVRLVTDNAYPVVAVPKDAVYTVAGLYKLFVIQDGKAVEHRIPQILAANGWVEMPQGTVPAGAEVAVSSLALLSNGVPVVVAGKS